jgi:hypothetical protein
MNKHNFNQSIGFPLETNTLAEMQDSWQLTNAFGAIVGNFSIISGCGTSGSNVANGTVYINGELLEFRGGVVQANVIIAQVAKSMEFENGESHEVHYTRYATFGTATTQWAWSSFKAGFETKNIAEALAAKADKTTVATALGLKEDKSIVAALIGRIETLEARPIAAAGNIPIGLVAMWGRTFDEIPKGWKPYVALKGRMPVGFKDNDKDFDLVGKYSDSKTKKLTVGQLPKHHFKLFDNDVRGGNPNTEIITAETSVVRSAKYKGSFDYEMSLGNNEATLGRSSTVGNDEEFSILGPYSVVHFIEYVGI